MLQGTTAAGPDPRCPYCGRPVIGSAVYGNEGPYHPSCVQPPEPHVTPTAPQFGPVGNDLRIYNDWVNR